MKKNKVLIVCILFVLILVIGDILLFKKNKISDPKKDNSITDNVTKEENNTINHNIMSIVKESNNKIYALTYSGDAIELMDISEYNGGVVYAYDNGKLYLYLYKYTAGKTNTQTGEVVQESKDNNILGYIDLTTNNYKFTKLADVKTKGSPESIAIVGGIIYFSSSAYDGIYKYNIDTKEFTTLSDFDFSGKTGVQLYTISNSKLGYSTAGTTNESPSIGIIDIKNGSKKMISSNASFEYVYNDKIIYVQYDTLNNYSKWKYYEYNVKDGSSRQISDSTSSITGVDDSFIVPIDNYYVYVNENTLNKYSNEKSEKIYEFDGPIDSINLISRDKLSIVYSVDMNIEAKYGIFDLNSLTFNENQNDISYSKILYLK